MQSASLPLLLLLVLFSGIAYCSTETYDLWDPQPACVETKLCPEVTHAEGYMNYEERLMFFLLNLVRVDPAQYAKENPVEFGCEVDDKEGSVPAFWRPELSWGAKFHARQMAQKEECYKFETCDNCELFGGSCSMEARIKAYYPNSGTELITKGPAVEALNALLVNPTYCSRIVSARWEELGVGMAKGPEGIYWSIIFGAGPSVFPSIFLVAGIHRFEGDHILFRGLYNDLRLDDTLKEKVVYLDEVPYFATLQRSYSYSKTKGKTGVWQVSVPVSDLEKMKDDDMLDPETHCHSYFFSFKTEHSSSLFRLPETGHFFLTGYGGCTDIYSKEAPHNPHKEKFIEEAAHLQEERKKRVLEREAKRNEERKRIEERKRKKNQGPSYTWLYLVAGVALLAFLALRKPRWLRF